MSLVWTRERDGEHNGKPVYEYEACAGNRKYRIVWAITVGFGLSAYGRRPDGQNESLNRHDGHDGRGGIAGYGGIVWCRTLKHCKARAEKLETENGT